MDEGKPVAAICHGPQVLISAGTLPGRTVTCVAGIRDDVKLAGARYRDKPAIVDRNLVTSRTPDDLPQFITAILGLMADDAPAEDAPVETPAEAEVQPEAAGVAADADAEVQPEAAEVAEVAPDADAETPEPKPEPVASGDVDTTDAPADPERETAHPVSE